MTQRLEVESKAVLAPRLIRPGRPSVRTTFQLRGELGSPAAQDPLMLCREAVVLSLKWLRTKFPEALPPEADRGETFKLEIPGQTVEAVALRDPVAWSARLVQPDAPFGGRAAVAGRTWTTEIGLALDGNRVAVSIRVLCASLPFATDPITFTRPRLVVDLASRLQLFDVMQCQPEPWVMSTEGDLERLRGFVSNPLRLLPVYVLTRPDEKLLGLRLRPFLLDEKLLARELLALGHVVCLPDRLSYSWTGMVSKPWSVYRGAVRTYRPGLDFANDQPTAHPLAIATRILAYHDREAQAEEAFTRLLIERAYFDGTQRRLDPSPCLMFGDALRRHVEAVRAESTDAVVLRQLYETEVKTLKAKVEEVEKEAETYNDDAIAAAKERDHYGEENRKLRAVADALRQALVAKTGEKADAAVAIPVGYDELSDWVDRNLAGRLLLHPRALQSLKGAVFENHETVYRTLLLLAAEYRDMRLGLEGARESWEQGLRELELSYRRSISAHRAGEQGDEYYVRYPVGSASGRRRFLEWHVRKGSSKNARYCLAIYFFWDEETQQVVIGSLPIPAWR